MRKYYLNPDKTYRKASLLEWTEQFEVIDKHVCKDIVNGKYISTVWLGLDHNFWGGEPLVFETMVFDSPKIGIEIYMKRYSTWHDAEQGHQEAIEWVKKNEKSI